MKNFFIVFIISALFCSCASLLDLPKKAAGYSISHFEKETDGKFEFNSVLIAKKAYNKCNLFIFENNLKTNFKNDKKLYVVASQFSLIFENCLDSTDVGFFVYPIDDNSSKIEVVSNNSLLSKFVYDKLVEYFK
jgi:hypothetical protein